MTFQLSAIDVIILLKKLGWYRVSIQMSLLKNMQILSNSVFLKRSDPTFESSIFSRNYIQLI